ncbi:hypothetical protein DFH07DRAFT_983707, partial [Mycena maculata]
QWCESYIVNHLSQHYLVHLLREKSVKSQARILFVLSGAVRIVDTSTLETSLMAGSGADSMKTYPDTKFAQLLAAHWCRCQLARQCTILAFAPGRIPGTGLGRGSGVTIPKDIPDAKSIPEGAASILTGSTCDDFPEDPEHIFLTSRGRWESKDVYAKTLDQTSGA